MKKWELISSKLTFDHRWFKVRQDTVKLPNGQIMDDYFVWPSGDVAMIVPVTKEGNLVLVKQYKHGIGEIMIEYPAGYLRKDENAIDSIKRELLEETAYGCEKITELGKVVHYPTKETGVLNLFLGEDLVFDENFIKEKEAGEYEEIEVLEIPIHKVLEMIFSGEIWATATVAATFLALNKLGKLDKKHE